jgi:hypothetical protein
MNQIRKTISLLVTLWVAMTAGACAFVFFHTLLPSSPLTAIVLSGFAAWLGWKLSREFIDFLF